MKRKVPKIDSATWSTWLNFGSKILVLAGLTPLVVSEFSVGEIALWYLFVSIQSLAHLLDLGFSTTIIRFTAYCRSLGVNWKDDFRNNYRAINSVFLVLSIIVALFLLSIGYFQIENLIVKYDIKDGWISWFIICLLFPINFFFKKNDPFLRGLNKVTLVNNWTAFFYLIYGLGACVILWVFSNFMLLVAWSQLYMAANSIKNYFLLKREIKHIGIFSFSLDFKLIKEFWQPTWKSSAISISSQGSVHFTSLFISSMLSVEIVASYLFTLRLLQLINEFSWAPFYSKIPVYISEFKKGTLNNVLSDLFTRLQISLIILIVGGLLFILCGPYVLSMFSSNVEILPSNVILIVLIALLIERLMSTHSQILMFGNYLSHYIIYVLMALGYMFALQLLKLYQGIILVPILYSAIGLVPLILIIYRVLNVLDLSFKSYIVKMKYVFFLFFIMLLGALI